MPKDTIRPRKTVSSRDTPYYPRLNDSILNPIESPETGETVAESGQVIDSNIDPSYTVFPPLSESVKKKYSLNFDVSEEQILLLSKCRPIASRRLSEITTPVTFTSKVGQKYLLIKTYNECRQYGGTQ